MALSWPVQPMLARAVANLPDGDRWRFEPKFDGFRCIALRPTPDRVQLQSRQLRSLTRAFSDVADHLRQALPTGTVLDGELVVIGGGRVSFEALQRRLAGGRGPSSPATLVAFDLLARNGEDLRRLPYLQRRAALEDLVQAVPGLALAPATNSVAAARVWMAQTELGIEGVVAKRADQAYLCGLRRWSKIRARATTEAIVGGVIGPLVNPRALILGRHDTTGRLGVIGRSLALCEAASRELGERLNQPRGVHPWPTVLAGGRFGLPGGEPVEHTPVDPSVVVEIETDSAFEVGRFRHGVRFVRIRADLCAEDIEPLREDSSL